MAGGEKTKIYGVDTSCLSWATPSQVKDLPITMLVKDSTTHNIFINVSRSYKR